MHSNRRNILVLGEEGTGKTSLISLLRYGEKRPLDGDNTRSVVSFNATFAETGEQYRISMLECNRIISHHRNLTGSVVLTRVKPIERFESYGVSTLHAIIICITLYGDSDAATVQSYIKHMACPSLRIALCVMHSEDTSLSWESDVRESLMKNLYYKELLSRPTVSLYFASHCDKLMHFIFSSQDAVPWTSVPVYLKHNKIERSKVRNLLDMNTMSSL